MRTEPQLPPTYLKIPERLNIADLAVTRHVRDGHGDRPAIHWDGETVTYRQLDAYVNRCGNVLGALGIERGDRFVIRAPNSLAYGGLFLAGLKIGAVPIPSSSLFRSWEVVHLINNSEAKVVFTTDDLVGPVDDVAADCSTLAETVLIDADGAGTRRTLTKLLEEASSELDVADTTADELGFIIYTSGTTARPKGVEHAHRLIVADGDPVAWALMQLTPDDICMQPQEISFIYSLMCGFLFPLYAGAQVVLYPGRFEPERALAAVMQYGVTEFVAVPTIFRMLLAVDDIEKRYDLGSLRMGISGGEPLPEDTYHESMRRFGFEIFDLIGQTEATIYMSNRPGLPVKPGSLGKPLPGRRASVRDDAGRELDVGEIGHLCIGGDDPALALGYRKQDELWQERFREGWFYSGDLAYRDDDGYYWYVSRADDLIKSRAYLISPKEVEAATMEHPAVLEAAVIGVPDPVIGQRVKAYVVLKRGHEPGDELADEIVATTRAVIAPYKTPKEIEFVAELPKTATGKIRRRELRERNVEK